MVGVKLGKTRIDCTSGILAKMTLFLLFAANIVLGMSMNKPSNLVHSHSILLKGVRHIVQVVLDLEQLTPKFLSLIKTVFKGNLPHFMIFLAELLSDLLHG